MLTEVTCFGSYKNTIKMHQYREGTDGCQIEGGLGEKSERIKKYGLAVNTIVTRM